MRIITWNVNGLRAVYGKNFISFIEEHGPDVLALQEIKAMPDQLPPAFFAEKALAPYKLHWAPAQKKGYAGTALFCRREPLSVVVGMGDDSFDNEGRVIAAEYPECWVLSIYFPNSQPELVRLPYKRAFNKSLHAYGKKLAKKKPVVLTGDFNVAHEEIDLAHPKENAMNPGFCREERDDFSALVGPKGGFCDIYRMQHPGEKGAYTWWTYRAGARERNVGWRIDYTVVSEDLVGKCKSTAHLQQVMGSDHCPVVLELSP